MMGKKISQSRCFRKYSRTFPTSKYNIITKIEFVKEKN